MRRREEKKRTRAEDDKSRGIEGKHTIMTKERKQEKHIRTTENSKNNLQRY